MQFHNYYRTEFHVLGNVYIILYYSDMYWSVYRNMKEKGKTVRVNLIMPKDLHDFLLEMVDGGEALSVSDAIRKCIIHYKAEATRK